MFPLPAPGADGPEDEELPERVVLQRKFADQVERPAIMVLAQCRKSVCQRESFHTDPIQSRTVDVEFVRPSQAPRGIPFRSKGNINIQFERLCVHEPPSVFF